MKKSTEIEPKTVREVSKVGYHPQFLRQWASANESTFEEVMDKLADELPQQWAQIYLKVLDKVVPKEPEQPKKIADTVNLQVTKIDALGDVKDSSWRDKNDSSVHVNSSVRGGSASSFSSDNIQYEEIK